MQFGGIDFSRVSLSQLAEYEPALSVLQLPYLYTDADQMWRVLDGTIGDEFLSTLESLELTGLSWFDAGVRSIYTRQKVTGLADLQGLTIRVQESDMMSEMITDLGAKPVKVVYSKVYAALSSLEEPCARALATITNTSTGAMPFSAPTNRLPSSPTQPAPGATRASTAPMIRPTRMRTIRLMPL